MAGDIMPSILCQGPQASPAQVTMLDSLPPAAWPHSAYPQLLNGGVADGQQLLQNSKGQSRSSRGCCCHWF